MLNVGRGVGRRLHARKPFIKRCWAAGLGADDRAGLFEPASAAAHLTLVDPYARPSLTENASPPQLLRRHGAQLCPASPTHQLDLGSLQRRHMPHRL